MNACGLVTSWTRWRSIPRTVGAPGSSATTCASQIFSTRVRAESAGMRGSVAEARPGPVPGDPAGPFATRRPVLPYPYHRRPGLRGTRRCGRRRGQSIGGPRSSTVRCGHRDRAVAPRGPGRRDPGLVAQSRVGIGGGHRLCRVRPRATGDPGPADDPMADPRGRLLPDRDEGDRRPLPAREPFVLAERAADGGRVLPDGPERLPAGAPRRIGRGPRLRLAPAVAQGRLQPGQLGVHRGRRC